MPSEFRKKIFSLLSALLCFAVVQFGQADETDANTETENCADCTPCFDCIDIQEETARRKVSLLDRSHGAVTGGFDSFAQWLDGFFGKPSSDDESAHSFVRLRYDTLWEEGEGTADKARIRGKVRLPLLSERVKLIFSDEENESITEQSIEDVEIERDQQESVGLEYSVEESRRFRLDYRVRLRSGAKIRTGVRARYKGPLTSRSNFKITEEFFWQDGLGFGTRTAIDLDYRVGKKRLLRWDSRLDFTEYEEGVPWTTIWSLNRAISSDHAVAYYFRMDVETRPDDLVTSYGPGLLYRKSIWKKWLFFELEPTYSWRRSEISDSRRGVAAATFRIEIVFSEEHLEKP